MRRHSSGSSLAVAGLLCAGLGLTLATPRMALACGGCFAPSQTVQVVTDHRMVMAVHANEAFLWDQIRYTGAPQDFAWVLPVSGDVQIDVASSQFFDELDAATAVRVRGPVNRTSCGGGGGGLLSASATRGDPSSGTEASEDAGVVVISQQVVGPYQTVTLRSSDATALTTWLQSNDYTIPASIQPVIQFYIDRHTDFVALRLAPGEGVQAMQPIRIRYASANVTLPLRMVSAGVADKVGITLWVFAAGRMEAMNYGNATIDPAQLAWNWTTSSSNYIDLFTQTLANTAGGRAWITEGSQQAQSFGIYPGRFSTTSAQDWQTATGNGSFLWITRMRSDLAARFLDGDLMLQASASNATVSNTPQTSLEIGARPVPNCPARVSIGGGGATFTCDTSRVGARSARVPWHGGAALTLAAALAALNARRRRVRARVWPPPSLYARGESLPPSGLPFAQNCGPLCVDSSDAAAPTPCVAQTPPRPLAGGPSIPPPPPRSQGIVHVARATSKEGARTRDAEAVMTRFAGETPLVRRAEPQDLRDRRGREHPRGFAEHGCRAVPVRPIVQQRMRLDRRRHARHHRSRYRRESQRSTDRRRSPRSLAGGGTSDRAGPACVRSATQVARTEWGSCAAIAQTRPSESPLVVIASRAVYFVHANSSEPGGPSVRRATWNEPPLSRSPAPSAPGAATDGEGAESRKPGPLAGEGSAEL